MDETRTLPTKEEIKDRYRVRAEGDLFGFEVLEYLPYTDWDFMKDKVNEGVTEKDFTFKELNAEDVLQQMEEYMPFAWGKANGCRGISAGRSIMHFIAWIWLIGDKEFADEIDQDYGNIYEHYGKEILIKICEHYDWDHKQWDDGIRTNG